MSLQSTGEDAAVHHMYVGVHAVWDVFRSLAFVVLFKPTYLHKEFMKLLLVPWACGVSILQNKKKINARIISDYLFYVLYRLSRVWGNVVSSFCSCVVISFPFAPVLIAWVSDWWVTQNYHNYVDPLQPLTACTACKIVVLGTLRATGRVISVGS